jgi:hypothetical protein
VREERVGAPQRGAQVVVALAHRRHEELPDEHLAAAPRVHRGGPPRLVVVGAHRVEREARPLDERPVVGVRGEGDLVPAGAERAGDREVRVDVAVRAEGGEDEAHRGKLRRRGAGARGAPAA